MLHATQRTEPAERRRSISHACDLTCEVLCVCCAAASGICCGRGIDLAAVAWRPAPWLRPLRRLRCYACCCCCRWLARASLLLLLDSTVLAGSSSSAVQKESRTQQPVKRAPVPRVRLSAGDQDLVVHSLKRHVLLRHAVHLEQVGVRLAAHACSTQRGRQNRASASHSAECGAPSPQVVEVSARAQARRTDAVGVCGKAECC